VIQEARSSLDGVDLPHGDTFILMATSPPTAMDFLYARIYRWGKRNKMARSFVVAAKRCIGVPVTHTVCNIGSCGGVAVKPDGKHAGKHYRSQVNERHTAVKDEIQLTLRGLRTSGRKKPLQCSSGSGTGTAWLPV
jgi:hypothetical protein